MSSSNWFDNDTGTYFSVGNRVTWHGDECEMEGVLELITTVKFGVRWEDGKYIEYSSDHQDAMKKC